MVITAQVRGDPIDGINHLIVILDNSTRWNSSYKSIIRGLKLKLVINVFIQEHITTLRADALIEEDWQ